VRSAASRRLAPLRSLSPVFGRRDGARGMANRTLVAVVVAAAVSIGGCSKPARASKLIADYANAGCVTPLAEVARDMPGLAWQAVLPLRDGSRAAVAGVRAPGGRISVKYDDAAASVIAADAGDYVYPADVRLSREREVLFVKAEGVTPVPWGKRHTLLFAYDVRARRVLLRQRVDPAVLPAECVAGRTDLK